MEKQKTDYDIRFKGWLNEHGVVCRHSNAGVDIAAKKRQGK